MTKGQKQVEDFMRFFGQTIPDRPVQLNEETAKLRAALILEEALETITKGLGLTVYLEFNADYIAINESGLKNLEISFKKEKEVDLVQLADGLADLAYVGEFGTSVAAGIDLEPIQDEVHASNMTKAWTEKDVEHAKELYPTGRLENYGGGLYRMIREDGKVIKSPSYREANLGPLIEAQINPTPKEEEDIYADATTCPNCENKSFSKEFDYCNECGCSQEPK